MRKSRILMILLIVLANSGMTPSSNAFAEDFDYTWNFEVGDTFKFQIRKEYPSYSNPEELTVLKGTQTIEILEINQAGWNKTDGVGYEVTVELKDQDGEVSDITNIYYTVYHPYFYLYTSSFYLPIVSNEYLESFTDTLDDELNYVIQAHLDNLPFETHNTLEITNITYDYGYEYSITDGDEINIEYKLLYNAEGILIEYYYRNGDRIDEMDLNKGIPGFSNSFIVLFSLWIYKCSNVLGY